MHLVGGGRKHLGAFKGLLLLTEHTDVVSKPNIL